MEKAREKTLEDLTQMLVTWKLVVTLGHGHLLPCSRMAEEMLTFTEQQMVINNWRIEPELWK